MKVQVSRYSTSSLFTMCSIIEWRHLLVVTDAILLQQTLRHIIKTICCDIYWLQVRIRSLILGHKFAHWRQRIKMGFISFSDKLETLSKNSILWLNIIHIYIKTMRAIFIFIQIISINFYNQFTTSKTPVHFSIQLWQ